MTNLQAAVGLAQFERINTFLAQKRVIADLYNSYLSQLDGIILPVEKPWAKSVFWMYSILIKKDRYSNFRDDLIALLKKNGIDSRPIFYPLHKMPPYRLDEVFPNAEFISDSGISLPSGVTLIDEEIKYICEVIKKYLTN